MGQMKQYIVLSQNFLVFCVKIKLNVQGNKFYLCQLKK